MTYFSKIPLTTYEFNSTESIVKDITRRSGFVTEYRNYTNFYSLYEIKDGETPMSLAYKLYSNSALHWVILLFNEIHDMDSDWPLNSYEVELLCKKKYYDYATNTDYMHRIRHYEMNGVIVGEIKDFHFGWTDPVNPMPGSPNIIPVTFYEHEQSVNDAKRTIKILRTELLSEFVKQFEGSISG